MSTKFFGTEGEMTAAGYLAGIGAKILDTNVHIAGAEIDIVAKIGETYAFVEVKRRSSVRYGRPAEAVNAAKMRKIVRAAAMYAALHDLSDRPIRFDIIELLPGAINHIPGAFTAGDLY